MNVSKHLTGWLALPVFAVTNGTVRDFTYGAAMGRDLSHAVSVVPLVVIIVLWAWFLARRWPLASLTNAWAVGVVWLVLTLVFEFGLGFLQGVTMETMLAEYDITRGRLWPLVPLAVLLAPPLMQRRVRRRNERSVVAG